jgi:GntR family transcriptional repressor for pyruvate dehydrogenase complex
VPTELEIVRMQGVSRTVVREAISHLQAAGLVETRHGMRAHLGNSRKPLRRAQESIEAGKR